MALAYPDQVDTPKQEQPRFLGAGGCSSWHGPELAPEPSIGLPRFSRANVVPVPQKSMFLFFFHEHRMVGAVCSSAGSAQVVCY